MLVPEGQSQTRRPGGTGQLGHRLLEVRLSLGREAGRELASSLRDRPLPETLVAFGEVGLTGEVRPVAYGEERLREAAKQGFRTALVPRDNAPRRAIDGLEVRAVARLGEAIEAAFAR